MKRLGPEDGRPRLNAGGGIVNKIIAVDFDGCLCKAKWPDIGEERREVINELLREQAEGAKLILWTCREGQQLQAAVMWCLNRGLKFDAVNDNLEANKDYFGNNSRKVYANEYWDDKSVCVVEYKGQWATVKARKEQAVEVRELPGGVRLALKPETEEDENTEEPAKGYQYFPPKKRLRDKLREIWKILKE